MIDLNNDSYIKLLYLRSRYYSLYLNQFIQADTIIPNPYQPISWNRYLYVGDNPINLVDPSGKCPDMDGDGRCDFGLDEIIKFQASYGVSIDGYNIGSWNCNGNELVGVIDGTMMVAKK